MTEQTDDGPAALVAAVRDLMAHIPDDAPELARRAREVDSRLTTFLTSLQLSAAHDQRIRDAVEQHLRDVAENEHDNAGEFRAEAQARTAFLISLSHDLRAPIGALVHQAQLLTDDGIDEDIRQRSIELVRDHAGLLSRIMDDLVDIERFAHGDLRLDRRQTLLSSLLEVIVESAEVEIEGGDSHLLVDVDVMTRAIRTLVAVKSRRYPTSPVVVSGRTIGDDVEITVRAGSETAPPSEAPDAGREIGLRLIGALVRAHGGSVTPIDHGLQVRLPRSVG